MKDSGYLVYTTYPDAAEELQLNTAKMKTKKKWEKPEVSRLNVKKTKEIIVHSKEVSPNWS